MVPPNRWASWQFFWGIAFAFALLLLFFWFMPDLFPGLGTGAPTASIDMTPAVDAGAQLPGLAHAQATLDAAATGPASIGEVMAAAQTVVAATETPLAAATPVPVPAPGQPAAGVTLFDRVLATIPGLTALVTFVGLVLTSLMKWRTDLRNADRQEVLFEQQRMRFELEQERHEIDRMRSLLELERQRFQLDVERRQLELKQAEERLLADSRRSA